MWSEQDVITWLAAHPFLRNEIVLFLGAVSALARKDWEAFKSYQIGQPEATFNWGRAFKEYSKAIVIAVLPPIGAWIWKVLGA